MDVYHVKRVVYGKKGVPLEQREYSAFMGGPVGCIDEIVDFVKQKMPYIDVIIFEDHIEGEKHKYDILTNVLKKI